MKGTTWSPEQPHIETVTSGRPASTLEQNTGENEESIVVIWMIIKCAGQTFTQYELTLKLITLKNSGLDHLMSKRRPFSFHAQKFAVSDPIFCREWDTTFEKVILVNVDE